MSDKPILAGIDRFRLIAAILVVAIHTSPLVTINGTANFVLTRIAARVAVPFFFMASGYFLFRHGTNTLRLSSFLKKTGALYIAAILLYLPLNFYNGSATQWALLPNLLRSLLVDGTFYHLWYLPAAMLGAVVAWGLLRSTGRNGALVISLLLYTIGLFGDSYFGFANKIPVFKAFFDTALTFSGYTRNGLFFAPLFFVLGARAADEAGRYSLQWNLTGLGVSLSLMITEGLWLRSTGVQRHDSMYALLPLCMIFLFNSLLFWNRPAGKHIRTYSVIVYILHPIMIVCVRGVSRLADAPFLVENSPVYFAAVTICSVLAAVLLSACSRKIKARFAARPGRTGRAWVEINLDHLCHNARALQKLLPEKCSIMAVVKANAYGHGDIEVSKALHSIGIRAFAVATIDEGIHLRKKGITGEILILGYTDPHRAAELIRYRLSQTMVDAPYAAAFSNLRKPLHVHVKVDTGMHRLGESFENVPQIATMLRNPHFKAEGIFTHLCASESMEAADVNLTTLQINRFFGLLDALRLHGVNLPKAHMLSSYGILNYNSTPCDYARPGLALYGATSRSNRANVVLKPVLSLKARVVLIRTVAAGESVGYGCDYMVKRDTRIAVLPIGYADGLPRNLGSGRGCGLLHGHRAPIIGTICMDQLMIDVTDISDIKRGDVATLIGRDGEEEILAEDVAANADTITNEILSRLGNRLERIYITSAPGSSISKKSAFRK